MDYDYNLFNAAIVGENYLDCAFILEDENHLHAVDNKIAELYKDKGDPKKVIPLIRGSLKSLIEYANGKVEEHFLDVKEKS